MTSGYASEIRAVKPLAFVRAFQAYVDDSASEMRDRRLFLAAYVNTADRWIRFADVWKEELDRAPSIEYLKMREAANLSGQFRGWSEQDRDEKLRHLFRIIRHFKPASFHASVSRADFERIVAPYAPYGMKHPYSVCFQYLIIPIANQQAQVGGPKVPIDFIFDNQDGLGETARLIYQAIRRTQPNAIQKFLSVDPQFRDDKLVLPLQAADVLAWHVRRRWEDLGPSAYSLPQSLDAAGFHGAVDVDASRLQRIADGFKRVPDVATVASKSQWKQVRRAIEYQMETDSLPSVRWTKFKNTVAHIRIRAGVIAQSISRAWRRRA